MHFTFLKSREQHHVAFTAWKDINAVPDFVGLNFELTDIFEACKRNNPFVKKQKGKWVISFNDDSKSKAFLNAALVERDVRLKILFYSLHIVK